MGRWGRASNCREGRKKKYFCAHWNESRGRRTEKVFGRKVFFFFLLGRKRDQKGLARKKKSLN